MFGKAEWFRPRLPGRGLHPVVWQGWAYSVAWILVIAAPFLGLVVRNQAPEAMVWFLTSLGLFGWDVRSISRDLRVSREQPLFYIGEDGTGSDVGSRATVTTSAVRRTDDVVRR